MRLSHSEPNGSPMHLIPILEDQLSHDLTVLHAADPATDRLLLCELPGDLSPIPHHKQKRVLRLSAMRHFAMELEDRGFTVEYVRLDDPENSGSLEGEIARAIARLSPERVRLVEPSAWQMQQTVKHWQATWDIPVEVVEDRRFLCSRSEFADWAAGRKKPTLEHFYRFMRRKTGWLMEDGRPAGNRWNFDGENRKPLPKDLEIPKPASFPPDPITRDVMRLVDHQFPHHFGSVEGFSWPVTRDDALQALRHFLDHALVDFGAYQDAMKRGDNALFHSRLSPALNIGLVDPEEVCVHVLRRHHEGKAPLASVEGFLRQILGWREYLRGIYQTGMPEYASTNALAASRPLPDFFWDGKTDMACIQHVIRTTWEKAYAHHIQRLMITGNFALLAGISPAEVEAWYLAVYADAFEWVELPNTHGMALFADGGYLATKPYAASAAYIRRMSDYCTECHFAHKARTGERACPFNFLYWNFLERNRARLSTNPRMSLSYRNLDRISEAERKDMASSARLFLESLSSGAGLPACKMAETAP